MATLNGFQLANTTITTEKSHHRINGDITLNGNLIGRYDTTTLSDLCESYQLTCGMTKDELGESVIGKVDVPVTINKQTRGRDIMDAIMDEIVTMDKCERSFRAEWAKRNENGYACVVIRETNKHGSHVWIMTSVPEDATDDEIRGIVTMETESDAEEYGYAVQDWNVANVPTLDFGKPVNMNIATANNVTITTATI